MTCLYSLQAISFIRGHYGKVATKAPSDRATGASAKAAIHLPQRAAPKGLSIFEIRAAYWAVLSSRHPPVLNHELVPDIAFGHCHAALIFHKPQDCPAYIKGGVSPP